MEERMREGQPTRYTWMDPVMERGVWVMVGRDQQGRLMIGRENEEPVVIRPGEEALLLYKLLTWTSTAPALPTIPVDAVGARDG